MHVEPTPIRFPAEAPLLGTYGTGAPISLAPVPGVAGLYAIEASADGHDGYTAQSVAKDLSSADATQNFILIP